MVTTNIIEKGNLSHKQRGGWKYPKSVDRSVNFRHQAAFFDPKGVPINSLINAGLIPMKATNSEYDISTINLTDCQFDLDYNPPRALEMVLNRGHV